MARTVFLKPRSVEDPSQGDFSYTPVIKVFETTTSAALEAAMQVYFPFTGQDPDNFWVVEEIEYQVMYKPQPIGEMSFSAMVWLTKVEKI